MGFGALFLFLIVSGGATWGYLAAKGKSLDESSKAYAEESVPAIVKGWTKDELTKRASPQLAKIIADNGAKVDLLFKKGALMGDFERITTIEGGVNMTYFDDKPTPTTANYTVNAKFKNGDAIIVIRLVQTESQWKMLYFNISSQLLME